MVDFGDIWEVFKVLAKEGGLGVIHAEDNDIVMHMYAKLIREGRVGFENLAEVHNTLSEDLSFRRVLRLAESVPGTALYMMHVSAATGVAAIREARAKGLPIYGESLHQYMLHTAEDYSRPNGQIYHTYPSLKSAEDQKALWDGTLNGAINCVATDELCCTLREKTMGRASASTTPPAATPASSRGSASCTPRWWRGAAIRCRATSISSPPTRPRSWASTRARARSRSAATPTSRSSIRTRRGKVRADDLHETDYTPWEGHDIFAWPVVTILRGKVMVENSGSLWGRGSVPQRKIRAEIIAGPMLGNSWVVGRGSVPQAQDSGRDHRGADVVNANIRHRREATLTCRPLGGLKVCQDARTAQTVSLEPLAEDLTLPPGFLPPSRLYSLGDSGAPGLEREEMRAEGVSRQSDRALRQRVIALALIGCCSEDRSMPLP